MTLEQLKLALMKATTEAEKEDIISAIESLLTAETEKGKSLYKKKDSEALKLKNAMKELGYDPETDGDLETFIAKSKSKRGDVESSKLTIAQLSEKLTEVQNEIATERSRANEHKAKAEREAMNSKLTSTIGDKIFGSKYVIESLINNKRVKIVDDNVVFANGEDIIPFDAGIKKVLEENKDMLKVSQNNGSNTFKTAGEPISDKDYASMSSAELRANIADVRKHYMGR